MKTKIFALLCLIASTSFAEDTIKLPESNVKSDYIEIDRLKPTKNIIVIEGKNIQNKGYQNLEEVLDDIPSINIGKTGWGDIDIRGQGADNATKNIQIMIDGAPIQTLTHHPKMTNYNVVPVENIERIEIIPGGGSIIYGSGSVGGIINITTNLKNLQKTKKDIAINIGTDKKDYMINLGHNFNDKLSAQFSYTKLDRDLYFVDTYRKSDYLAAGLNYKIKDNQNLSFRYSHLSEKGKFLGNIPLENLSRNYRPTETKPVTTGLNDKKIPVVIQVKPYLDATRKIDSYNLSYTGNFNPIKYNMDLFYSKGNFLNDYDKELVMKQKTIGIKNKLDYSYGKNTIFNGSNILFGLDYFKQSGKLENTDYKQISDWSPECYVKKLSWDYNKKTLAFYLYNNLKYKKFDFSQGIRRDITYWGFDKISTANQGNGVSRRGNTNYELALAYNYRDTGKIYARYERSFTSPDGNEITDTSSSITIPFPNNPDDINNTYVRKTKAKDTKYDIFEIGLRDKIGFSTVVLTAFMNKTDNEMSRIEFSETNFLAPPAFGMNTKQKYESVNILKSKRKGIELTLSQKFGNLSLEESYAYLKGSKKYNSNAKNYKVEKINWTNAGIKKVPKHSLTLKAKYDFNDNYSANIKYKYLGKYSNFIDENIKLKEDEKFVKSYSTVDIGMNYKNENGISISAGINNLFNKKYFEYVNDSITRVIPGNERNYYMGMKYTF